MNKHTITIAGQRSPITYVSFVGMALKQDIITEVLPSFVGLTTGLVSVLAVALNADISYRPVLLWTSIIVLIILVVFYQVVLVSKFRNVTTPEEAKTALDKRDKFFKQMPAIAILFASLACIYFMPMPRQDYRAEFMALMQREHLLTNQARIHTGSQLDEDSAKVYDPRATVDIPPSENFHAETIFGLKDILIQISKTSKGGSDGKYWDYPKDLKYLYYNRRGDKIIAIYEQTPMLIYDSSLKVDSGNDNDEKDQAATDAALAQEKARKSADMEQMTNKNNYGVMLLSLTMPDDSNVPWRIMKVYGGLKPTEADVQVSKFESEDKDAQWFRG